MAQDLDFGTNPQWARDNPFKIGFFLLEDREGFHIGSYILKGDVGVFNPRDEFKDKDLYASVVAWKNRDEKSVEMKTRLNDLKEDYCKWTGTDGSKVDWVSIVELK